MEKSQSRQQSTEEQKRNNMGETSFHIIGHSCYLSKCATKNHRRHNFGSNRLKGVRALSGAVTNIVTNEVRNHRGVARVILGDTRLYLANQVRTNIGTLKEE